MRCSFLCLALITAIYASTSSAQISDDEGNVSVQAPTSTLPDSWVKGPFIEIYVRGFKDSNGDGHGDLNGVIEKLDYLKSVGFTGIWLMPVFESEDHNHGYAPANFRQIERKYGSNADMQRLIAEAHQRGIGIMMDYIPNHAASTHPIFQASKQPDSPYRDWFIWGDAAAAEGWSGFTGAPWVETPNGWFYAVYDTYLPDFNWRNPAVMNFHLNNLKFWLNQGVDGFRMDAVGVLVENGPSNWQNQPENYSILQQFQQQLHAYPGQHPMICEGPGDVAGYASPEACGSAFAFGLQNAIIKSAQLGRVDRNLVSFLEKQPIARLGTFLSNHDTFAGVRLFNQLDGDLKAYRLAAATQYLIPGTPYTLYGEEVGMSMANAAAGGTDEQIRSTMPWTGEEFVVNDSGKKVYTFGGFTQLEQGRQKRLFRAGPDNSKTFNVADEEKDPNSLLSFYRDLIKLRRETPALLADDYQRVEALNSKNRQVDDAVFAFTRGSGADQVLVAINYGNSPRTVSVKAKLGAAIQGPFSSATILRQTKGKTELQIPAQSFAVYTLNQH